MRLRIVQLVLLSITLSPSRACPSGCVCKTEFVDDLLDPFVDCSFRGFTSIPEGIPSNTTHLDLRGNNIRYLPYGGFGELGELVFLDLSGSGIRGIADGAFANLTKLELLRLYYNKISELRGASLSGMPSLKRLEAYDSGISVLGKGAFRPLSSIENIDLSHNRITAVDSHVFVNLPALAKVSLRHNRIATIHLAAFMGLHNFTYLHLSSNRLKNIREGAIIDVPNLKTVFLFDNPLVCDCEATWLYEFLKNRSLNTAFCERPGPVAGKRLAEISRQEFCGGPEFYVHPMPIMYAQKGQTVTLICGAIGTPHPQIYWSFDKKPIVDSYRHEVTYSGDLVILDAKYSDSGTYHCTASSAAGAIAAAADLFVGDPPRFNQSFSGDVGTLADLGAAVGGTAVIGCPLTANPAPEYVWEFEGYAVDFTDERFLRTEDGTLVITDVKDGDFGRYVCLAKNYIGTAIYTTDMIAFQKPTVERPLDNWIAPAATNVTLYCDIRGYPAPPVSWYKDGVLIAHDGTVARPTTTTTAPTVRTDPHLLVNGSVDVVGDGNDTSNATDGSGLDHNDTSNATDGSGLDGSDMFPTLEPVEPSLSVGDGLRGRLVMRRETLVIVNALESDSGLYECRAVNSVGSAGSSAYVLLGGSGKPVVSVSPTDETINAGETVFLYCNVTGNPDPNVRWTFKDRTVYGDDSRRFLSSDNTLVITDVEPSDDGYYRCHAENIAGYASESVHLTVQSLPKFIELSNDSSLVGWQSVNLKCLLDRTVKPAATLTWYFNGKRLPDDSLPRHEPLVDGHLVIAEVEGSDAGLYACKAENSAGVISHSFVVDVHVPLKISKGPVNKQAVVGSAAVFTCHADGTPTPTYEWRINDFLITDIPGQYETHDGLGVLTIVDVKQSDGGFVTCVATAANLSMRAHARLEVLVPPFFVQEVSDAAYLKGSTVNLKCAVSGNPEPEVTWQRDGMKLPSDSRYRITPGVASILAIDKLKPKDSGEYTCTARSALGSVSSSGTLQVQERPVGGSQPIVQQEIRVGDSVRFPCNATGEPPPRIRWIAGTAPLRDDPRYTVSEDGSLIILSVRSEDSGEFACLATNAVGTTIVSRATLDVEDDASTPYISICPRSQTARPGQNIRFECFAMGRPMPTIQWLHNGENVVSGRGGFNVTSDGTLTIANVRPRHAGEMTCVAENVEGTDSFVTSLTVIVPPTFTKEPIDTRQAIGRDVLFQCAARGTPTPTILWTKSPFQLLPYSEMRHFNLEDGSLLITNVRKSDEGLYVCEAVNPRGRIMRAAELLVEGENITDVDFPMMNWTRRPENVTIPEGRTAVFVCSVASFPPATYAWSYNGSIIPGQTERQFTTINGSLVISDVDYTVEGAYTCTASNGVMYLQHTAYLKTLVAPDIYQSPRSQALAWSLFQDGVNAAEFRCEAYGFPVPTIHWTRDGRRLEGGRFMVTEKGHLTIRPLAFEDAGEYTCVATSSAGVDRKTASLLIQDNRPRDYCMPTLIYHHVRHKNCRTEKKVDNYKCEGHCFSQEYPDSVRPATEQKFCCRVKSMRMRHVKVKCPNGSTNTVYSPAVKSCDCAICVGVDNVVLPVNEYR